MNVLFLDYDGVVNNSMWDETGTKCRFNHPFDNKVNNFQAVQWISEFCQKFNYSIVVTSTWRMDANYKECLRNGGLRPDVEIIGRTPITMDKCRGEEIQQYLDEHSEVGCFIIVDDENDMAHLVDHLVLCNGNTGFNIEEFFKAKALHEKFCKRS